MKYFYRRTRYRSGETPQDATGSDARLLADALVRLDTSNGSDAGASEVVETTLAAVPFQKRPVAAGLIAKVQDGDVIEAGSLADLFRNALDAVRTIELLRSKSVKLRVVGIGDLTEPRLFKIAQAFADIERERAREKTLVAHAATRAAGKHVSGRIPFGYVERDGYLVEDPQQQDALGWMRARRAAGDSYRTIQAGLHEKYGVSLSPFGIQRIVENKRKVAEDAIRQRSLDTEPVEGTTPRRPVRGRFKKIPD